MTSPMAVRLDWGKLHLAGPTGRGYKAACGRFLAGEDVVAYWGAAAASAWRLEAQCLDCRAKLLALKRRRLTP